MTDIIITIPKTISWKDYCEELRSAAVNGEDLNYQVTNLPVNCSPGDKCYVVHNGFIQGYMDIKELKSDFTFICTTTGKVYGPGNFIVRSGYFRNLAEPFPLKGFQGYRYVRTDQAQKLSKIATKPIRFTNGNQ